MSQDVLSAPDALTERSAHTVLLKKPAVIHAFAEGGGVLGMMFPVIGHDWEEKTGIPFGRAIHVKEAVSTGMPFMTGISLYDPNNPGGMRYSCQELMAMYNDDCQIMFAKKPRRLFNLVATNGLNLAKRIIDPTESRKDRAHIERIKHYCDLLSAEVPQDKKATVAELRERASKIWLTRSDVDMCLKISKKISEDSPGNTKKKLEPYVATASAKRYAEEIGFLLNRRSTAQKGLLSTLFARVGVYSMDKAMTFLGPRENRFHSPEIKQQLFHSHMGDVPLTALAGSVYTAAFSPRDMSIFYMYSRRDNLLDMNPQAPVAEAHPPTMKAWDANMATTANLLAFPPHITEYGTLTADKATIHHSGFVISQILKYKPADMGVISITLSTGHTAVNEMNDKQLYEFYADNGEIGNDHFLEESKAYTTTAWHKDLATRIGEENIYYLSPRMSWKDLDEEREFPSTDITDGSPENMQKIKRRAEKYLHDKQDKINRLWQTLADNMYLLGHIDKPKFDDITARLGVRESMKQSATPLSSAPDNILPFPASISQNMPTAAGTNPPPPKPIKFNR